MGNGQDSNLVFGYLIDDAVREPSEDISPTSATKYCANQRIGKNEIGRSFKLRHKRKPKLGVRFKRIERSRVF